jgi:hypothetical protein
MAQSADLQQPLFLISKGVSEETAFGLSPRKRLAWCIAAGINDGGEWDWSAMKWREKS